eukprot:gb/GECG01000069.1/.p1 GENE.gb/GECG01000069.1/~~gb/GECG01000069.1/.p1  ORF type:complete len:234 (+),score=30.21 gb/GECG01000069.1/:1-702(+)
MGNANTTGARPGGTLEKEKDGGQNTYPEFIVTPRATLEDLYTEESKGVILRLEAEALSIFSRTRGERVISFPYHSILCWRASHIRFSWKYHDKDSALVEATVATKEGHKISQQLLDIVRTLMDRLKLSGIEDQEYESLKEQIREDPESALQSLKQVSLTRLFSVKQASVILDLMEEVSEFEKVDAAVILSNALVDSSSFTELLERFYYEEDKENVRHRVEEERREAKRRSKRK